jgi:hypothetical protein
MRCQCSRYVSGGRCGRPRPARTDCPIPSLPDGRDRGQRFVAVICEIAPLGGQSLYCWTPNDGYTITMLGYPLGSGQVLPDSDRPRRLRSNERGNRHHEIGAAYLPRGVVERYGSFMCVSRASGLTCRNQKGHGWSLPRYRGLPFIF